MLLAVLTVAMATVLAVPFLAGQSTTTRIARSMDQLAVAQQIAASGLNLALAKLQGDTAWRSSLQPGQWITNQAFADGSYSLWAYDGRDPNGDGNIQGDNNFANNDTDPVTLICTATRGDAVYTLEALYVPTVNQPAASGGGVMIATSIELTGNSRIDALDSSTGSYSPWSESNASAVVVTNTVGNNDVHLTGSSTIEGKVLIGPGGSPGDVLNTSGSARVTGSVTAAPSAFPMDTVTIPPGLPPAVDYDSKSYGTAALDAGTYHYSRFDLTGSLTLNITGKVVIYCDSDFSLGASVKITLDDGASLTLYAPSFSFSGSGQLNMNSSSPKPSAVTLYQTGTGTFSLSGSAQVAACVIAPQADIDMSGNSRCFGSVHGQSLDLSGSARFTQDLALSSDAGGGGTSGGGGSGGGAVASGQIQYRYCNHVQRHGTWGWW